MARAAKERNAIAVSIILRCSFYFLATRGNARLPASSPRQFRGSRTRPELPEIRCPLPTPRNLVSCCGLLCRYYPHTNTVERPKIDDHIFVRIAHILLSTRSRLRTQP